MLSITTPLVLGLVAHPGGGNCSDITEDALRHKSWAALGMKVFLADEVKETLVDWTDRDARRSDTGSEINSEIRLDNLLAEAATAVRGIQWGADRQIFLAEYFDRTKRGNPRRTKVQLHRSGDAVVIAFPD